MKKGILGGTFDPIHLGHLTFAEIAINSLELDELWLIPNAIPWLRREKPFASPLDRMAMVNAVTNANSKLFASSIEIDRAGDSYTVDTLEELCSGTMAQDEVYLLLGADALETISKWKNPARIFELVTVVAVPRNGRSPSIAELDSVSINSNGGVLWLEMVSMPVSSTLIRSMYARGEDVSEHLPAEVIDYIKQAGIYEDLPKVILEDTSNDD